MNYKKKYIVFIVLVLIVLIGVSYAFFNYYKIGVNRELIAGDIYLNMDETGGYVTLTNVFPETVEEARARTDNVVTFTIDGRNTSINKPIYYEIMLDEGNDNPNYSTRIKSEHLRFDLIEIIDGVRTKVVDAAGYQELYKTRVWVNQVDPNTNEVSRDYELRVWISEDVLISDTDPKADYLAKTWKDTYASIKVSVYGDFEEKKVPGTMARLGTESWYFWSSEILSVRDSDIIKEVKFIKLNNDEIDTRYNAASIKSDVTTNELQPIKAWLEENEEDSSKSTLYIASADQIYFPSDISDMFRGFSSIEKISFDNVNTSQVKDMGDLFSYCKKLVSLDLSCFNTSQVNNMSFMFQDCENLIEIIGLETFNTTNVTNMDALFYGCESLKRLNLSNWDTSKLTTAITIFTNCTSLEELNVNGWDTSKLTYMSSMFNNCKSLTSLDLSTWDMSNVEDTGVMFQYVSKATEIKLPNSVKVIGAYMFNHNYAHTGDTFTIPSSVTTMGYSHMWYGFGTTFNEFIVEDGNQNFKVVDGVLYTIDGTRLISVPTHKTNDTKTLEIPEGVTFINENSFSTNKKLETLILPDSYVITRYVGKSSNLYDGDNVNTGSSLSIGLYLRTNIGTYIVKDTNPNYTSIDGCLYSKDGNELIAVPWQYNGALSIKEGTIKIGQEAFWTYGANSTSETTKLTSVYIPASVTTIESAQITALNKLVGRITITIDENNPNYTISGGKIVTK